MLEVDPYGLVDTFKINAWLIGNLNPAPHYLENEKFQCGDCESFFSYMPIDPLDFPLKYGCTLYPNISDIPEVMRDSSKKFFTIEKTGKPYVVFPEVFRYFEVFYPSVDIFDNVQKNHSKNVLLGAIQENIERLFQGGPFIEGISIPKKSTLSIDFQYDQINKITRQTFDFADVPKWQCPFYEPNPEYLRKLEQRGKTIKEVKAKKFRLEKRF